jgi:hypothetical protein
VAAKAERSPLSAPSSRFATRRLLLANLCLVAHFFVLNDG